MRIQTIVVATLVFCSSAFAEVALTYDAQQPGDPLTNILFNGMNDVQGPATTIKGHVQGDETMLVDFTSSTALQIAGGGQAQIMAAGGGYFGDMSIYMDNSRYVYDAFIFSLAGTGTPIFTVWALSPTGTPEAPWIFDPRVALGTGQNWFSFTATAGEQIQRIEIAQADLLGLDVGTLDHPRIGDISTMDPVPEPSSWVLLITVAGLLAFLRFRPQHGL